MNWINITILLAILATIVAAAIFLFVAITYNPWLLVPLGVFIMIITSLTKNKEDEPS